MKRCLKPALLSLLLLFAILLCPACGKTDPPGDTSQAEENTTASLPVTEPEPYALLDMTEFYIVNDTSGKKALTAAVDVFRNVADDRRARILQKKGSFIDRTHELHFGLRALDDERAKGLGFRDWRMSCLENGNVEISAISVYGLVYAAQELKSRLSDENILTVSLQEQTFVYEYADTEAGRKLKDYENVNGRTLVMSHRGDFVNYPENSLPAFSNCAEKGVDIIEMDVVKTASGSYMLMHDASVNRTTNGSGNIAELEDTYLRSLRLKNKSGGSGASLTSQQIPYFSEVLDVCKDKILINLDKFDTPNRADVYKLLCDYGMVDYAVFKGSDSFASLDDWFAGFIRSGKQLPTFSPMIYTNNLESYRTKLAEYYGYTAMSELGVSDFSKEEQTELCEICKSFGIRPMVLTLNSSYNGVGSDGDRVWDTLLSRGFTVFMTNKPLDLIKYLAK